MTDSRPHLTDEDLCAVIDGVADPELTERVRSDPEARARAEELHAAGEALRAAPLTPLDPATVDALVARAVQAAPTGRPDPMVTPLPRPPAARRGPAPWLVAAAVVALVAVGLGLVWSGTRTGDQFDTAGDQAAEVATDDAVDDADGDTTAGAEDLSAERSESGEATDGAAADEAPALPHGAVPTTGGAAGNESAVLPDLGSHATAADLRTALRDGFPDDAPLTSGTPADSPTRGAVDRCRNQAMASFDLDGPSAEGVARVDGRLVLVYEFDDAAVVDGNTYVIARGPEACDPVLDFQR